MRLVHGFQAFQRDKKLSSKNVSQLFHEGGPYHIEASPLICSANQLTGFYVIEASVMKELCCFFIPLSFGKNMH